MKAIDIIILSSVLLVVAIVIGLFIYKKVTNKPMGECGCCSSKKGLNRALNKAKKELDKEEKCNCKKNI